VGIFAILVAIATALYWGQHRLLNVFYALLAFALTFFVLLRVRVKWLI